MMRSAIFFSFLVATFHLLSQAYCYQDPPLDVVEPRLIASRAAAVFDFTDPQFDASAWTGGPTVTLTRTSAGLFSTGSFDDPYFFSPDLSDLNVQGDILIKLTARRTTHGFAQIFTSERDAPEYAETRATRFSMEESGAMREYLIPLKTSSPLRQLRFDLGLDAGTIEVAKIVVVEREYAPLKFGVFSIANGTLDVELLRDGKFVRAERFAFPKEKPFEEIVATARYADKERVDETSRRFYAFHEDVADRTDRSGWHALEGKEIVVRFAPDASGAEIARKSDGKRVAALAPLLDLSSRDASEEARASIEFDPSSKTVQAEFHIASDDVVRMSFTLDEDALEYALESTRAYPGPVLRALGTMRQGVLPGVEYLEEGERSSSTRDVNPAERARYRPDPLTVTAPFMAIVTDRASIVEVHSDPKAQVEFAVPNFLDGDETSSRFNISSKNCFGKIRFSEPSAIEDSILWAVQKIGLPDVPKRPRTSEEEDALHLAALERSAIKVENGWISCAGPGQNFEKPHFGTDFLSTVYELTGVVPKVPRWDVGGAGLRNYSAFFVADKTDLLYEWLDGEARAIRASQKSDGSFRYSGKYLRGSDVDYASGDCARYVYRLLDHWRMTGNQESFEAGVKGLEFINALLTPRGAQTWEISLHTPDLVAAARCSYANTLAYEGTRDARYLAQARRWAIAGLPFIYLWSDPDLGDDPVMRYASIPVFGTTDWIAPCWIGTPVQWCGLDYADAILYLAKYDDAIDWLKLADGLVTCAEQMEYPDGIYIGLLPDSYFLDRQMRNPLNINPCATHRVRKELERARK